MLARLKHCRSVQWCCCLLILQLLNISVDPPDQTPTYLPEDLSYNEPESLLEIVAEHVLGYEDLLPEQDDNDSDRDGRLSKTASLDTFLPYVIGPLSLRPVDDRATRSHPDDERLVTQHYEEQSSPPPEA